MSLEQEIKDKALELGFDAVGITDAVPIDPAQADCLHAWLDLGFEGQMQYMARNVEKRVDPGALVPGAEAVVVVALNYKPSVGTGPCARPGQPQGVAPAGGPFATVADFACYEDYHDFMRPLLHALADFIGHRTSPPHRFKACVDSVPLAERSLAMRAGLGFIGRNHVLIHPTLGPQILLGEIITTARLRPDPPSSGACGGCDRCIRACPTGALRTDAQFDANRCISYLTIEHEGPVEPELAARMGDRVFGCDECVLACPCQGVAPLCSNRQFQFYPERKQLDLPRIEAMTPESFEAEFAGSPLHRPGLDRLKRNARICLNNLRG